MVIHPVHSIRIAYIGRIHAPICFGLGWRHNGRFFAHLVNIISPGQGNTFWDIGLLTSFTFLFVHHFRGPENKVLSITWTLVKWSTGTSFCLCHKAKKTAGENIFIALLLNSSYWNNCLKVTLDYRFNLSAGHWIRTKKNNTVKVALMFLRILFSYTTVPQY